MYSHYQLQFQQIVTQAQYADWVSSLSATSQHMYDLKIRVQCMTLNAGGPYDAASRSLQVDCPQMTMFDYLSDVRYDSLHTS